nr:hypothetical protein [Endozoicomonas sp. YOMI1]
MICHGFDGQKVDTVKMSGCSNGGTLHLFGHAVVLPNPLPWP